MKKNIAESLDTKDTPDVYKFSDGYGNTKYEAVIEFPKFEALVSLLEPEWYEKNAKKAFDHDNNVFAYEGSEFVKKFSGYTSLAVLNYKGHDVIVEGRYNERAAKEALKNKNTELENLVTPLESQVTTEKSWVNSGQALINRYFLGFTPIFVGNAQSEVRERQECPSKKSR